MPFDFSEPNNTSRARLRALTAKLTDADLSRTNDSGWTVASFLVHLAFWDQRMVVLIKRFQGEGASESPIDSGAMNDALKPIFLTIEPKSAIKLALEAADAADAELETLTPQLIAQLQAVPMQFRFDRSLHRNDHLNEIEHILASL